LKTPVIVSDIASDPLFVNYRDGTYRDIALSHGLRASWSQPLISKNQEVLGTFAMYYAEARIPSDSDLRLIEGVAHIALIAIERTRTEAALQESEERFRRMADAIPEVIWITALEPEGSCMRVRALNASGACLSEIFTRIHGSGQKAFTQRTVSESAACSHGG
jgi:GAF domain-containing protein